MERDQIVIDGGLWEAFVDNVEVSEVCKGVAEDLGRLIVEYEAIMVMKFYTVNESLRAC